VEAEVEVQEVEVQEPVVKSEPQHYAMEQSLAPYQAEEEAQYEEDYGGYGEDGAGYEGGVLASGAAKGRAMHAACFALLC
jgi:hypothetical protein